MGGLLQGQKCKTYYEFVSKRLMTNGVSVLNLTMYQESEIGKSVLSLSSVTFWFQSFSASLVALR
jgi:hypothetical protein